MRPTTHRAALVLALAMTPSALAAPAVADDVPTPTTTQEAPSSTPTSSPSTSAPTAPAEKPSEQATKPASPSAPAPTSTPVPSKTSEKDSVASPAPSTTATSSSTPAPAETKPPVKAQDYQSPPEPEAPTFTDECGTEHDTVTIPDSDAWDYYVNQRPVGAGTYPVSGDAVKVTARPKGEGVPSMAPTSWRGTYTDEPCETTPAPEPTPAIGEPCGDGGTMTASGCASQEQICAWVAAGDYDKLGEGYWACSDSTTEPTPEPTCDSCKVVQPPVIEVVCGPSNDRILAPEGVDIVSADWIGGTFTATFTTKDGWHYDEDQPDAPGVIHTWTYTDEDTACQTDPTPTPTSPTPSEPSTPSSPVTPDPTETSPSMPVETPTPTDSPSAPEPSVTTPPHESPEGGGPTTDGTRPAPAVSSWSTPTAGVSTGPTTTARSTEPTSAGTSPSADQPKAPGQGGYGHTLTSDHADRIGGQTPTFAAGVEGDELAHTGIDQRIIDVGGFLIWLGAMLVIFARWDRKGEQR